MALFYIVIFKNKGQSFLEVEYVSEVKKMPAPICAEHLFLLPFDHL